MKRIALFLALLLLAMNVVIAEDEVDPTMNAEANAEARPIKIIAQLDAKLARERYLASKENYTIARERYMAEKKEFQSRNNTKPVRERNNTENFEKDKAYLMSAADKILSHLERLKGVADSNNRTEVSASIQTYIDAVVDIQADINASTTFEQLKAAAQELRKIWGSGQSAIARNHGLIFANKIANLIDRMENAVEKIDSRIGNLSDIGYNVSNADEKIDEILDLLAQAKQKVVDAKAEFALVTGSPGNDEHWKKGHELLKEANSLLREAHKKMVEFLKEGKEHIKQQAKEEMENKREELKQEREEIKERLKDRLERLKGNSSDDDSDEEDSDEDNVKGNSSDDDSDEEDSDEDNVKGNSSDDDSDEEDSDEDNVNRTANVTMEVV